MDTTKFDAVTRHVGTGLTRRGALRGLFAGAVALTVGGVALNQDADAKRRRRKNRKNKKQDSQNNQGNQNQLLEPGSPCQTTSQCTPGYICEVPVNGSNSDLYCSGGPGAICGAPNEDGDDTYPFCAVGHDCVFNGSGYTCQAVPEV